MSVVDNDYDEKRNFIRMFVDAKVVITDPDTGKSFAGESKNLSGNGVLFSCDHEFELDKLLDVSISSQQSQLRPLNAKFEVKRVEKQNDGSFEIGGVISGVE